MSAADDALFHAAGALLDAQSPSKLGVAVSGGSDSIAALNILTGAARARDISIAAITINHGLRAEAEAEAAFVAESCKKLGIRHDIRRWQDWDGSGNLQAQARDARYGLMAAWARETGVDYIALGHTQDDQAETFLMRLARGAGVDGLSEMKRVFSRGGVTWLRPFLRSSRAALRAHLLRHGLNWVDDPSNDDPQFERVRLRQAMAQFGEVGLDTATLSQSSQNLADVRDALDFYVRCAAADFVQIEQGDVLLSDMSQTPPEVRRRLISAILRWMSGDDFAPRAAAMAQLQDGLDAAGKHVLAGCVITRDGQQTRFTREWNAVRGLTCATDEVWDNRWRLEGPHAAGLHVRALGEDGLSACPDWRSGGLPRVSLLASPSVWDGETLVSAPLTGGNNGWNALLRSDFRDDLQASQQGI